MVASNLKDVDDGLIEVPNSKLFAVPAAVLYGPNASGKSNLVSAIRYMRSIVVHSHATAMPDTLLPFMPFGLDASFQNVPTKFHLDFVLDGVRYSYGFAFGEDEIFEESLFAFPSSRAQMLFTRERGSFSFGRKLKGRNQIISELTRKNSLFLSAAAQNDHDELGPIYNYFKNIVINRSIAVGGETASRKLDKGNIDPRVLEFLEGIGTGVVGYRRQETEVAEPFRLFQKDIMASMQRIFGGEVPPFAQNELVKEKNVALQLAHRAVDGDNVYFDLVHESSGTRRLLLLLSMIFEAIDKGSLIVIDEIDASLHTQACELLLLLFSDKDFNRNNAQVIATIHDTNLLSSQLMRRDQVWFCEKQNDGSSTIYPLSDIHVRTSDSYERGYLQGRFGALPTTSFMKKMQSRSEGSF